MHTLSVYVYKDTFSKGCSNHGISEKFDRLLLICEDGNIIVDENDIPENLVKMVTRQIFGKEHKHIEPYRAATGRGWMAGGAFAYTSDSRFPHKYPLSIHDRQE